MRLSPTVGFSSGAVAPAQGTSLLARLQSRVRNVRASRALRRRYRNDARQLERFNDRELWDLGLSRSDIPSIAQGTYRRD